jgi:diguanylate cyclase (GGDEF)-like protein
MRTMKRLRRLLGHYSAMAIDIRFCERENLPAMTIPPKSIRGMFIVFLLLFLLVVALSPLAFFLTERHHTHVSLTERLESLLNLHVAFFSRWYLANLEEIRAIAGISSVENRDLEAMYRDFLRFAESRKDLAGVAYVDEEGRFLVDSSLGIRPENSPDLRDREYFQAAHRGEEFITPPLVGRVSGNTLILFSVPVFRQGTFDGLVLGSALLEDLAHLIGKMHFGETGRFLLYDGMGHLLSGPKASERIFGTNLAEDPRAHPLLTGRKGSLLLQGKDERGEHYYRLLTFLEGRDLILGAEMTLGEYQQSTTRMVRFSILSVTLFAALGVLFFLLLFSRMSRALSTLLAGVSAVGEGNYTKYPSETVERLPQELGTVALAVDDLKERVQVAMQQLRERSLQDSLTGLANRTLFEEEMHRHGTGRFDPVTVVICDLDGLKLVNDTLGHAWGDELIRKAASLLQNTFRAADVVARIGGDEFAVLVPFSSPETEKRMMLRLEEALSLHNAPEEHLPVLFSWGMRTGKTAERSILELFKDADEIMYAQKDEHRKKAREAILKFFLYRIHKEEKNRKDHMKACAVIMEDFISTIPEFEPVFRERLIRLAAWHDIGMVGIQPGLLAKTEPLSEEEFVEIRRHPEIGHRIALAVPALFDIAEGIRCHHQWWNGEGYPAGGRETSIPLESRIMTLVDAFESMTNRLYKPRLSPGEAREEIRRCAGTQFDPEWAERFLRFASRKFDLP